MTGIGIGVYITVPGFGGGTPAVASFAIDNSPTGNSTSTQGPSLQYKFLFYQSPPVLNGDHTFVLTNRGNSTTDILYLDYFEILQLDSTTPATPVPSITAKGATTSNASSNKSTSSLAIILVPVLCGLLVVIVLFSLCFQYRRMKAKLLDDSAGRGQLLRLLSTTSSHSILF